MIRPNSFGVYDIICRNAQIYPSRDCVIFEASRLSFKDFKQKCDSLSAGLVRTGIEKGDRIAILANNSSEYMFLYGAAAKVGAIVVPINWRFQEHEIEYVLRDSTPKIVVAGHESYPVLAESIKKISSIQRCYLIGDSENQGTGVLPFEELYSSDVGVDESQRYAPEESAFVIIYTAAVEGYPRGAVLSQANLISCNIQMMHLYSLGEEDCCICVLPFFHIAGLSMALAVMHAGGKNVVLRRFDAELFLKLTSEEKATTFLHFPPMLKMITEKYNEKGGSYDLSSLKNVGGLDQPDNIARFKEITPNARFWTAFGQTEAMPVTGGLIDERPGSAGKPTCLSRVALFDDEDREVPVGSAGEICVRSPVVFMGYWGRDEDTANTFRNGWHHTGDIGRLDEDGYLWYVKRKAQKELIKPGGENVYPAEVEKVILEHDDIAEVSVIGVPDEQWGEAIKAVCVLKPGRSLAPEALIEFVASRIARYKKPKYVTFVDSLPKTKEGKIDRDMVKKEHGGKY